MRAHGGSNPHRIVPHGPNRMVLSCARTGQAIVEAKRPENSTTWTLTAPGVDAEDRIVGTDETRAAAVDAMIAFAFEVLPHEGIEVHVPERQLHPDEAATEHFAPRVHYKILADGNEWPFIHLRDEQ